MAFKIPDKLLEKVPPEVKMDVTYIDVKLKNDKIVKNITVRGGSYITSKKYDFDEKEPLGFSVDDIADIRESSIFNRLFNRW